MVTLNFDASQPPPEPKFHFTFGASRSEIRWQDRRELNLQQINTMLSSASVGAKDGTCYTPAIFSGFARRMDQATQIDVAVLDADCGHSLADISSAIKARGWQAIIHSTYSHLSDTTVVAASAFEKWSTDNLGLTIADYMLAKKGYLRNVIENATIVDDVADNGARNLVIKHNPCPKFRILLPLEEPWIAEEFESQNVANQKWRERIGALASALGLNHDQSCVDTSRLFYLPRLRHAEQEFIHASLDGIPCPLWSLPDAAPADTGSLFHQPAASPSAPLGATANVVQLRPDKPGHKLYVDSDGVQHNLSQWAAEYALRFEVVTALRARSPGVFSNRNSGPKKHIYCPNSGDHVTGGVEGTGSFAVNAGQMHAANLPNVKSGFFIYCSHGGCTQHDRLDHLRAMLEDGTLFVEDLTNPDYLTPELPQVDSSALVHSTLGKRETANPAFRDIADTVTPLPIKPASSMPTGLLKGWTAEGSNIDSSLYTNLPGILGQMHDFILRTSPVPQPVLALGTVLTFCAAAIGRRVKLERFGIRPNLYILTVGWSGSGKDRPMAAVVQMARAAGLYSELIGVEEIASDSGIVSSVMRQPRQLILIDEVGFILSASSNAKAPPHLQNVIGTLLKLYSHSDRIFKSKSYAEADKVKTIDQPCVSFYGSTTPRGLSDALTTKDITSGLLSRMMLLNAGDNDPISVTPGQDEVPSDIVDWLLAWEKVSPVQNPLHRIGGEQELEPRTVMMTDEAYKIGEEFKVEMHAAKIKARDSNTDSLYVRAHENALKLALIRACSILPIKSDFGPVIDESALNVDAACMRWAVDLSRSAIRGMVIQSSDLADSGFEVALRALRNLIKKAGEQGATSRDIARAPCGRMPKKQLEELLDRLAVAGDIFYATGIKTKGRDRHAWVHDSFRSLHQQQGAGD